MAGIDLTAASINDGVGQITGRIDSLQQSNTSGLKQVSDGISQVSKELLKTEVDGLPQFIKDILSLVSQTTEGLEDIRDALFIEQRDESSSGANVPGQSDFTDKDLSKLPAKYSAGSLYIGSQLKELFGEKSFLYQAAGSIGLGVHKIYELLEGHFGKADKIKRIGADAGSAVVPKPAGLSAPESATDKTDTDKLKKMNPLSEMLSSIIDKITGIFSGSKIQKQIETSNKVLKPFTEFTSSLRKIVSDLMSFSVLFTVVGLISKKVSSQVDNIKGLLINLVNMIRDKELNVTKKDIDKTKNVVDFVSSLAPIFTSLHSAMKSALIAGMIAVPASVALIMTIPFMWVSSKVMTFASNMFGGDRDFKAIAENTTNMSLFFQGLLKAELAAISAGLLAIPAAVSLIAVLAFIFVYSKLGKFLDEPFIEQIKNVKTASTHILITMASLALTFFIMRTMLDPRQVVGPALLALISVIALFGVFWVLGEVAGKLSKGLGKLTIASLLIFSSMALLYFSLVFVVKISKFVSEHFSLKGAGSSILILLGVFATFALLGFGASYILPFLGVLAIASLAIMASTLMLYASLIFVVKIADFVKQHFVEGDSASGAGTAFGVILLVMFGFAGLGIASLLALPFIASLLIVSASIMISSIFLFASLIFVNKIADFVKTKMLSDKGTGDIAGSLGVLAIVISGFIPLGIISLFALAGTASLIAFSILAATSTALLSTALENIQKTIELSETLDMTSVKNVIKSVGDLGRAAKENSKDLESLKSFGKEVKGFLKNISGIASGLSESTKVLSESESIRTSIQNNIAQPLINLERPKKVVDGLTSSVKNLNEALTALSKENKDTLQSIGQIGKDGVAVQNKSLFGVAQSSKRSTIQIEQDEKAKKLEELLAKIEKNTKSIDNKTEASAPKSWSSMIKGFFGG